MRTKLLLFRSCMSLGRRGIFPHIQLGSIIVTPTPTGTQHYCRSLASVSTSTVSFEAPEPPKSHGTPVFPDIHFDNKPKLDNQHVANLRNSDSQAVFIVNGSSRGIGLQFVKSLLHRTKGIVIAGCRSPTACHSLIDVASEYPDRVQILPLDMEDQSSIDTFASTIAQNYQRVDALINVAGILGDGKTTSGPERSLASIERNWMEKTLAVNIVGPTMLIKALSPLMRSAGRRSVKVNSTTSGKGGDQSEQVEITLPAGRPPTVIVNLSARVGSVSDNQLGGWYTYRLSKTALNQVTRTMGHELKRQGTWIVALHPGTTDTDLSKPFQGNVREGRLFPVEFTVDKLLSVVESMEESHSGGFYDWAGKALPF